MKGYIYYIYIYVTMVIPINPKRSPQVWELGWVGWDYGKRIDIFYLSFPFQARVVIGEGLVMHLEALAVWGGWQWKETMGLKNVIWTAKTT